VNYIVMQEVGSRNDICTCKRSSARNRSKGKAEGATGQGVHSKLCFQLRPEGKGRELPKKGSNLACSGTKNFEVKRPEKAASWGVGKGDPPGGRIFLKLRGISLKTEGKGVNIIDNLSEEERKALRVESHQ